MGERDEDSSDFSEDGVTLVRFKENCNEIIIDDDNENPDNDVVYYMCNLCSREFNSRNDLYQHENSDIHIQNLSRKESKQTVDLTKDETYIKLSKEEENKWIAENLNPELGFGFDRKILRRDINVESPMLNKSVDETTVIWKEDDLKDYQCLTDDMAMRRMREKIHHPLELFGTECGVPSEDEEADVWSGISYSSFGKEYTAKGRLVKLVELEAVGKEEQVERDIDERVTRLPGGYCLFEKMTDRGIQQRVVLVTTYRDMDQSGCCPEPRKK